MTTTIILVSVYVLLFFLSVGVIWKNSLLKAQIKYQQETLESQRNVIGNQSATIDSYKSILANGVTINSDKPYWLNDDLCREIKELWNSTKNDAPNPRVQATKIIQEKSLGLDKRKLTIQDAADLIKKHCLNIV